MHIEIAKKMQENRNPCNRLPNNEVNCCSGECEKIAKSLSSIELRLYNDEIILRRNEGVFPLKHNLFTHSLIEFDTERKRGAGFMTGLQSLLL